jgi:ssDNA-binding Zn-finger/Zn-ribbon topoisomerase 1
VACSSYPECKQVFSFPKGLIKNENKKCEECGWPLVLRIMQGKRPWQFCFNPNCITRKSKEPKESDKYVGDSSDIKRKKIEDIEKVEKV